MKAKDLEREVQDEILERKKETAKEIILTKLKELEDAKKVVAELQKQYDAMLEMEVDEFPEQKVLLPVPISYGHVYEDGIPSPEPGRPYFSSSRNFR